MSQIKIVPQINGSQLVYKYGVRMNLKVCGDIDDQIRRARAMYNNIIAVMRGIYDEMQTFTMEHAGPEGQALHEKIVAANVAFDAAKADNDEPRMKQIAMERRELWKALSIILKEVRKEHKNTLKERFYSRIGNNSSTETYQCRAEAIVGGLGYATATKVLDNALKAWQMSMVKGKAPRFARGEEKDQDTLTLQFSQAGGVPVEDIFTGKRKDIGIEYPKKGFGPRSYSAFRFRLGAASEESYAEGTVQLHRAIPENARIAMAHLTRKKAGRKYQYELQLLATLAEPINLLPDHRRKPLVAIHFGWSGDEEGRRLAGIADNADPLEARLLTLPPDIEDDIREASALQAKRDTYRDEVFLRLKEENTLPTKGETPLSEHWNKIRKLPAQHVSANRMHHLAWLVKSELIEIPEWFETWRKADQRMWVQATSLARRARNRRKKYYEKVAIDLASRYEAILIEMPDLKKSAEKVNEKTGEKTEFAKKARSGRVIAALYVLESAIQWAACKHGSAVLKIKGEKTASVCAFCEGDHLEEKEEHDSQTLYCPDCGSTVDRKLNGAANAWKRAASDLESLVTEYWEETREKQMGKAETKRLKSEKMAEARRLKRQTASQASAGA